MALEFIELDEPSPPARLFDSLEELRAQSGGKFLLPAYVPADVNPTLHGDLIEVYRLYANPNKRRIASGYTIGYRYPDEMVGEMLQDGILLHSYDANVGHGPLPTPEKVIEPLSDAAYSEVIEVSGKAAGFCYRLWKHWLNGMPEMEARLRFIGPGKGNSSEELYIIWLSCVYEEHIGEEEVRELIKGEFIKIAESMIEQGLPK